MRVRKREVRESLARRVHRAGTFVVILLLAAVPTSAKEATTAEAAAGPHPVADLEHAWLDRANATTILIREASGGTTPTEVASALRVVTLAGQYGEILPIGPLHAYFLATGEYANVSREAFHGIDFRTDGKSGCVANSSCARFLSASDRAANESVAGIEAARADLRERWGALEGARGLEAALVAEYILDDAELQFRKYADARARVVGLRSYDPDSAAYQRLLTEMFRSAHSPRHDARMAIEMAGAAEASDTLGPRVDAAARDARSALAATAFATAKALGDESADALADALRESANASYPGMAAAFLRYRQAAEHDRLLFSMPDDAGPDSRMEALLQSRVTRAAEALDHALALGFEGILPGDALAQFARHRAEGLRNEAVDARDAAVLLGSVDTQVGFLDPVVASPPPEPEPPRGFAVAAVAATLVAFALVGGVALLLRRKT